MKTRALLLAGIMATVTCQAQTVAEAAPALTPEPTLAPVPVPAVAKGPDWTLVQPRDQKAIVFQGASNLDNAGGGSGNMVYPAIGGALGFLAAIATHGVIVESQKSAEKARIQKQADAVLEPFSEVLKGFALQELMQKGVEKTSVGGRKKWVNEAASGEAGWIIDSVPVFSMTQDRETIILDNLIMVRPPGASPETAYKNTVRVVSKAMQAEDLKAYWNAEQGAKLKEESIRLFAQSLDLGLTDAQRTVSAADTPVRKTVRYMEGTKERMERGEVIEERCGRTVMKNLRGWVMSVPSAKPPAVDASCG